MKKWYVSHIFDLCGLAKQAKAVAKTINTKKKEEHATLAETVAPLFFSLHTDFV